MTGVVLRCPSCGTTQAHAGECDACYEAQVRYFCDNHNPGRWLDEPQCTACGARYGEAPKRPVPPSPVPAAPVSPRVPPTAPGARSRGRTREPPKPPATRSTREPARDEPGPRAAKSPGPPDLAELLRRTLRGPRERYDEGTWGRATPPMPRLGIGGCLRRVILFAVILFALILMGSFFLVGGALHFLFGGG
jgi:hypothetical protein